MFPSIALFRHEVVRQLRRARTLLLMLMLVGVLVLVVFANWPSDAATNWSRLPRATQSLLGISSVTLLVGACLFIPGLAAAGIVTEKAEDSWDLLSLTLISPTGLFGAKVVSSAALYLLFVVAAVPITSVVFFLIGVDWAQLLSAFAITATACVTLGTAGVACSAVFKRVATAVAAGYACMIFVTGLPHVMALLLITEVFDWSIDVPYFEFDDDYLAAISPFAMLIYAFEGIGRGGPGNLLWFHLGYNAVLTLVALLTARIALRGMGPRRGFLFMRGGDPDARRKRAWISRILWGPRREGGIGDRLNPVYVKETRWGGALSRGRLPRAFLFSLPVFALTSLVCTMQASRRAQWYYDDLGPVNLDEWHMFSLFWHGLFICLFIPTFLANTFVKERETENLDMLRISLLTPGQIVRGKFLGAFRIALLLLVASMAANLMLIIYSVNVGAPLTKMATGYVSTIVCVVLALQFTMLGSLVARGTGSAIVVSFFLIGMNFVGVTLLLALVSELLHENPNSTNLMGYLVSLSSPAIGYFVYAIEAWNSDRLFTRWLISIAFYAAWIPALYLALLFGFRVKHRGDT